MRRSERIIIASPSARPSSGRPHLFKLPRQTRPIWAKDTKTSNWPLVVFFVCAIVLAFYSFTRAAPSLSRGARPIGLGGAYVAEAGDGYSLFYNPAGLSEVNQKEVALDYGRHYGEGEPAGSDFNGVYATPYRFKDKFIPLAVGIFGWAPAPGAHIVDISAGGGADAPVDRWTKGLVKFPVRVGAAMTIRQQGGETKSTRVGKSSLGLGLTGGLFVPVNRNHHVGFALRNLAPGGTMPGGAAAVLGILRRHKGYLNMFADLEYGSGGVWRFHPGLEWLFSRGVLRPRLGWGYRDTGGIDSVSTGLGVYLSPMQIDFAYLIPVKTLNDNAGQFRGSLTYRFGRPQFSEIYYDRALEAASQLDQTVLTMSVKEAELKASLAEIEQKKRLAADELDSIKSRIRALSSQDLLGERDAKIRELKNRVQNLEADLADYRGQARRAREKQATVRTHVVVAGDTLQSLAKEYYGDPNQWKKIYNANPDKIDRGLPRVGTTLVIP